MNAIRQQPLLVNEIFHSIQGEGTHAGLRYVFVRLSGCNLRCSYCDTSYAFKGGRRMSVDEVAEKVLEFGCKNVLLTGGEPLLQRPSPELVRRLASAGLQVSIETHGEVSIESVAAHARIIMDIKTPSSGMCRGGFEKNLLFLKTNDEIKFVIASQEDYFWARGIVGSRALPVGTILFSPAQPASGAPGKFAGVELRWLAEQIVKDRLGVRLQVQLHKLIWGSDIRGV